MKLRTRIRLRYTRLRSAKTRAEQMRQVVSETHPDDLRERIAEAVHGLAVEAPIGVLNGRDSRAVADAVIRELGLLEEWLVDDIEPYDTREQAAERKAELIGDYGDDPPAEGVPVRFRYVTDWTAERTDHP